MQNQNTAYGVMLNLCCLCDNLMTIMKILMAISHEKLEMTHISFETNKNIELNCEKY